MTNFSFPESHISPISYVLWKRIVTNAQEKTPTTDESAVGVSVK